MGKSISITLWAFLGLESAAANSDAVENPKKNVPIAVMGGTIGAAIMYILSTNVILGISPIKDLAKSSAPFGLAFSHMFNPTIGNIVIALMIISCFGSLIGWQFTIAEVFRSSAVEKYFPKIFAKTISNGTPIIGMVIITVLQTLISLMTISPSLSKQFTILVNLAVVTNAVPYVLTMASIKTMQKETSTNISNKTMKWTNIIAILAGIYTLYAIYSSGGIAVYYGAIVTFAGWTLYGFISYRFDTEKSKNVNE